MIPENIEGLSEFEIASLFRMLEPLERDILKMRFGIPNSQPQTLEETGDSLGLTREDVRRTEIKAMCKLGWIKVIE